MAHRFRAVLSFLGVSTLVFTSLPRSAPTVAPDSAPILSAAPGAPDQPGESAIGAAYGQLPLSFEANLGQADEQVDFIARGSGYTLFLTPAEAVLALRPPAAPTDGEGEGGATGGSVLRMQLVGANAQAQATGREELSGKVNYFVGNDPARWRTNVPTYARVTYGAVYPGVDVVYYGNQGRLEYDFVVAPGADPGPITLGFSGTDRINVDEQGDLVLQTPGGELRYPKPFIYQEIGGAKQEVLGGYLLTPEQHVSFYLGTYDNARPLIIDPVLVYSTYLGGSGFERSYGIAVDGAGNAYVSGTTGSPDFPTPGSQQPPSSGTHAYVVKLNLAASGAESLTYSTYLGGSGLAFGFGIALEPGCIASCNVYLTGITQSPDFPPRNARQSVLGGGRDAFLVKLDAAGSALLYSTYLGGNADDDGLDIAVDPFGNAYVTGQTASSNFPPAAPGTTPFDDSFNGGTFDAFVAKLDPAASGDASLIYSTYLGGRGNEHGLGIAVDESGNAYVIGTTESPNFPSARALRDTLRGDRDAFVAKLNSAGSDLVYSTYLGGDDSDRGIGIAVDSSGNAYVTGATTSTNFPTAALGTTPFDDSFNGGTFDAFVAKLDPAASGDASLIYSTYLGGSADDGGVDIAVGASGNVYLIGVTTSTNFPLEKPLQPTYGGPSAGGCFTCGDIFVAKLDPAAGGVASLMYSTYLGGSGNDGAGKSSIAVDASGNAYVTGQTASSNFPTANPLQSTFGGGDGDAFVAKLQPGNSGATPTGSNVPVAPGSGATLSFSGVSSAGTTSVTTSSSGPTPPAGFGIGSPPTYYNISTTATFTPPVTVCLAYDPAQHPDSSTIKLFHFENGAWEDVTASVDTAHRVACGQVSSFSPFVVASQGGGTSTNAPPTVGTITAPIDPVRVDTAVSARATFTDQDAGDSHTATWDWGDGSTSAGTVTEAKGSGTVGGGHTYAVAGVYAVKLTVQDKPGLSGEAVFRYVVVYDPDGGFVTGGGWIESPSGACRLASGCAGATGKANFGFVSKYQRGLSRPTGNTEFDFKAGGLNFHSEDYDWLVISGAKARYRGTGRINGAGRYGFMLTAIDGKVLGDRRDRFRIRIWDKNDGDRVVYDNQMDAPEDADPTTELGGGSITVHKER